MPSPPLSAARGVSIGTGPVLGELIVGYGRLPFAMLVSISGSRVFGDCVGWSTGDICGVIYSSLIELLFSAGSVWTDAVDSCERSRAIDRGPCSAGILCDSKIGKFGFHVLPAIIIGCDRRVILMFSSIGG